MLEYSEMRFRLPSPVFAIAVSAALIGALFTGQWARAQDLDESAADQVAPSELQIYIDVYSAMQANHDLQIGAAVAQKDMSLSEFRNLERRVQKQERLVQKVREALTANAKARAEAVAATGGATEATPARPASHN